MVDDLLDILMNNLLDILMNNSMDGLSRTIFRLLNH